MQIKETLEQLGIADKKAEIYLTCLEKGGSTAYLIAQKVGLKRPTVYDILNQLLKEGLVYKSIKNGIKYFSPSDPQILLNKLEEKREKTLSIMPILQNLYNSPKTKPFIRYFEGKEGIKEMYEDSLRNLKKGDEILAYVGDDIVKYLPQYASRYVKERIKRGIRLRGIYKQAPEIIKYTEKDREQLRVSRVINERFFPVNNEINIYKDKIAIANYGQEMFGIIIESKELAQSQKSIFELAWLGSEKYTSILLRSNN